MSTPDTAQTRLPAIEMRERVLARIQRSDTLFNETDWPELDQTQCFQGLIVQVQTGLLICHGSIRDYNNVEAARFRLGEDVPHFLRLDDGRELPTKGRAIFCFSADYSHPLVTRAIRQR